MYNQLVNESVENFHLIKNLKAEHDEKAQDLLENRDNHVQLYFRKFLGQEINLEKASEPTDIIWENREVTHKYR